MTLRDVRTKQCPIPSGLGWDMNDAETVDKAVELLQNLGEKQYEAKCFVALSQISHGTAKEVSELTDVPRTRVYDAMRSLEQQGLVEVQHASPQVFRAVSLEEAVETLRERYNGRVSALEDALDNLEPPSVSDGGDKQVGEVWALRGDETIATRTQSLIDDATEDIALVVGTERVFSDTLLRRLSDALDRGVTVSIGAQSDAIGDRFREALPDARVFTSGLEWLQPHEAGDTVIIGRLLMIDGGTLLVSSYEEGREETAIYGSGVSNGYVVVLRRLLATGFEGSQKRA